MNVSFKNIKEITTPKFREKWEELLNNSENLDRIYQSPEWYDILHEFHGSNNLYMGMLCDSNSLILGVAPISLSKYNLKFDMYSRTLADFSFDSIHILGSELLLPEDKTLYDDFFLSLSKKFKKSDCVVFESIKVDKYLWEYFNTSKVIKNNFIVYMPELVRQYHNINLPETYDEYLAFHPTKVRSDFKRRLKKLKADFDPVEVKIYERPEEIETFLEHAGEIEKDSWKYSILGSRLYSKERYKMLAEKGLFYSPVLYGSGNPLAFFVGYIYKDTYLGVETVFKKSLNRYSPGIILFFLFIQHVIENRQIKKFNVGYGHSAFKQTISNNHTQDATFILFKKTLKNRIFKAIHSLFTIFKESLKKLKS